MRLRTASYFWRCCRHFTGELRTTPPNISSAFIYNFFVGKKASPVSDAMWRRKKKESVDSAHMPSYATQRKFSVWWIFLVANINFNAFIIVVVWLCRRLYSQNKMYFPSRNKEEKCRVKVWKTEEKKNRKNEKYIYFKFRQQVVCLCGVRVLCMRANQRQKTITCFGYENHSTQWMRVNIAIWNRIT